MGTNGIVTVSVEDAARMLRVRSTTTVRLPVFIRSRVETLAHERGLTFTDVVREALVLWLEENDSEVWGEVWSRFLEIEGAE